MSVLLMDILQQQQQQRGLGHMLTKESDFRLSSMCSSHPLRLLEQLVPSMGLALYRQPGYVHTAQ